MDERFVIAVLVDRIELQDSRSNRVESPPFAAFVMTIR